MDYKTEYNKALEAIKELLENNPSDEGIHNWVNDKFPGLLESGDEKIRKSLLSWLQSNSYTSIAGIQINDVIDWVENQGKKKPQGKSALEAWKDMRLEVLAQTTGNRHELPMSDDTTKIFSLNDIDEIFEKIAETDERNSTNKVEPIEINPTEFDTRLQALIGKFDSLPKKELIGSLSFWLNVVRNDGTYKSDEKQDEKPQGKSALEAIKEEEVDSRNFVRSADRIKPKFKVSEWIVQENIGVYKVIEVCESWYEVVDNKDKHYSIGFDKEYMCHLWTIKDAKDGDVLFQDLMGGKTFIYNGVNPDMAILYSYIISNDGEDVLPYDIGKPNTGIGNIEENKNIIYPATKEQRDFLFQKMHEADYEWDAKEKELKEIDSFCKENCKGFQETGKCYCDGECNAKRENDLVNCENIFKIQ